MRIISLGEVAFDAYNSQPPNPWTTWDGKPVPKWHELTDQVRAKWDAAATAIAEEVTDGEVY